MRPLVTASLPPAPESRGEVSDTEGRPFLARWGLFEVLVGEVVEATRAQQPHGACGHGQRDHSGLPDRDREQEGQSGADGQEQCGDDRGDQEQRQDVEEEDQQAEPQQ